MSHVRKLIVLAGMCVGIVVSTSTSAQMVDPELRKAVDARDQARNTRNIEVWSRLTTDQYVVTTETGELRSKADQLARFKAIPPDGAVDRRHDENFRTYGNTVVLTLTADGAAGPRRETHIWVKEGGQWKVAAVQITMVKK